MKKIIILLSIIHFAFAIEVINRFPTDMITDISTFRLGLAITSRDNSIKFYKLNSKGLLYQGGFDSFAEINAVAANDKYIAYSGRLLGYSNTIKIYKILKNRLVLYKNLDIGMIVSRLMFVGKYLVATTLNDTITIYNTSKNFKKRDVIPELYTPQYGKYYYGVDKINDHKIVFVNWNGDIYIYDIDNDEILKHIKIPVTLQSVKVINGKIVVSGYDDNLYLFDLNLNLIKKINIGYRSINLAKYNDYLYVLPWGGNEVKVYKNFHYLESFVLPLDGGECFSLGSKGIKSGVLFNCSDKIYIGLRGFKNAVKLGESKVFKPLDIAMKNNYIYLTDGYQAYKFDINNFKLTKTDIFDDELAIKSSYGKLKVTTTHHLNDTLTIYNILGNKKAIIIKNATNGYAHYSVGWIGKYVASGGSNGDIYIYKNNGDIVTVLHTKNSRIVDINYDGKYIIAVDSRGIVYIFKDFHFVASLELFKDKNFILSHKEYYVGDRKIVKKGIYSPSKIKEFFDIKIEKKNIKIPNFYNDFIKYPTISPNEKYLVFVDKNYLKIFDLTKDRLAKVFNINGVKSLLFDGKYLYVSRWDSIVRIDMQKLKIVFDTDSLNNDMSTYTLQKVGDKFYTFKNGYKVSKIEIYSHILEKLKSIKVDFNNAGYGSYYFMPKHFYLENIDNISLYSYSLKKLKTLNNRDLLCVKNGIVYTIDDKNNIKLYDKKLNFIKKIAIKYKKRIYAIKGFLYKNSIYLETIDGVLKVDLNSGKVLDTLIPKKDTFYMTVKNHIYITYDNIIKIYDKNLKLLKTIVFNKQPIYSIVTNGKYILTKSYKSVKLLNNKLKTIKNFKPKEGDFYSIALTKTKAVFLENYGFYDYYLYIYNLKTKHLKIIHFFNKGFCKKIISFKNKIYILTTKNIVIYDKKIVKLAQKFSDIFVSNDKLYTIKNQNLYKFGSNKILKKYIKYGKIYKNRGIYYSGLEDALVVFYGKKIDKIPTNKLYHNFVVTKNFLVTNDKHHIYVWNKNLVKRTYNITNQEECIMDISYSNNILFIATDFGRVIKLRLGKQR